MASHGLEELLAAYFDGALDEAGAGRLEELLAGDGRALERFAGLARVEGLLRARAAGREASERLTARVMRAVWSAGSRRRFTGRVVSALPEKQRRPGRPAWRLIAAAAAAALVGLGAWALLRPKAAGVIAAATGEHRAGERLSYGRALTTGGRGSLAIELADGSSVRVSPRSRLTVAGRRALELSAGRISVRCRADRENVFDVSAAGTEAQAVGTEFSVELEEEAMIGRKAVTVTVLSGVVLVSNPWGRLEASAGQTVISKAGAAPKAGAVPEKSPGEDPLAKKVTFEFVGTPLSEVCKFLGRAAGLNVTCDQELAGKLVTLKMQNVTVRMALEWISRLCGGQVVENPDGSATITKGKGGGGNNPAPGKEPEVF